MCKRLPQLANWLYSFCITIKTIHRLFIERKKESAQKVWSKDMVHKKTLWLSSRTPLYILLKYEMVKLFHNKNHKYLKQKKNFILCHKKE